MPLQRIGILGGTFDPVHFGHLRLAIELRDALQVAGGDSQIHLIPCHRPPHRDTPLATSVQRMEMLGLATAGLDGIYVNDIELRSDAPSYSVETLAGLHREYPSAQLVMAVGADAFAAFCRWHRWQDILELASIVVSTRPGDVIDSDDAQRLMEQRLVPIGELREAGQIAQLAMTALDISSSNIRRLVARRGSVDFLLPDVVLRYIDEHGLYRPG